MRKRKLPDLKEYQKVKIRRAIDSCVSPDQIEVVKSWIKRLPYSGASKTEVCGWIWGITLDLDSARVAVQGDAR